MAISLKRYGRVVKLNTFTTQEVVDYLKSKLTHEKIKIEKEDGTSYMVKFKGAFLIIDAKKEVITLIYFEKNAKKIVRLIELIKKWDKFSGTKYNYCIDIVEDGMHSTIFENGSRSFCEYCRNYYRKNGAELINLIKF